jgi:hypothetical protein
MIGFSPIGKSVSAQMSSSSQWGKKSGAVRIIGVKAE